MGELQQLLDGESTPPKTLRGKARSLLRSLLSPKAENVVATLKGKRPSVYTKIELVLQKNGTAARVETVGRNTFED